MMKKVMGLLFALLVAVIFIPGITAHAAPKLKASVSAGIDGKAKYEKGGLVSITVENTGTPFSGDLVVDVMESHSQGMGRSIPLEIGAGETKTVSFVMNNMESLSGYYGSMNMKSIYFYEDGWEKGKELPHTGAQRLTATLYYDEKIIVTFTNNVDRLVSLKSADIGHGNPTQLINSEKIGLTNLPDDALGWDAVDYMVIDEYPIADLVDEKQNALLEWVNKGGIIIIGSSDNIEGEAGVFSPNLPLKLKEQMDIDFAPLNKWAKTEEFDNQIPAYSTELNKGAVSLVSDDGNVLIAYKKVGQGLIIQTAFSLGDEPIAKSAGMSALWGNLFTKGEGLTLSVFKPMYNPLNQLLYTVGDTNELFPSFKVSAPLIFGIIVLYLIVIIPVMYFILKRKDKREHAWWIIPAIALITSVAIFGYGAKDRIGRTQIQHSAVLNVEEDGSLRGYYAESILSNKSGDFIFTAPPQTTLSASLPGSVFDSGGNMLHKRAILETDVAGSTMHFRNIGYWNVATVYGESHLDSLGEITMDLVINNGVLTGSLVNEFPFEIKDLAILSGNNLIPIKDMGPGEKVEIKEKLKSSTLLSRPRSSQHGMYQGINRGNDLMKIRKDSIQSFANDIMSYSRKPVLIGYTDTQIIPVSLEHIKTSISALTMIMQPVEVEVDIQGEITLNSEMFEMTMSMRDVGTEFYIIDFPNEETYDDGMEYTQTWKLPNEFIGIKMNWKSLTVSNLNNQLYNSSLLNIQTDEYEQIDDKEKTFTNDLSNYMTDDGVITIQIKFHGGQSGRLNVLPKIELTGEVTE